MRRTVGTTRTAARVGAAMAAASCGALLASCTGGAPSTQSSQRATTASVKPDKILSGPAGLLAAASPQPNGAMWLLAQSGGTATLQRLDVATGKIGSVLPESTSARSLAQSPSGALVVGLGTGSTGAVEIRNGSSGALTATVPVGAPVKDVVAGADGATLYVLDGTSTSSSVTLVSLQTDRASASVPVPLGTVSIAVDPSGQHLYALTGSGKVDEINVGDGAVLAEIAVGSNPVQVALSDTGSTLYVLKHAGAGTDVGVVDLATERQTGALAAPAHCVEIVVSPAGGHLYDVVGTPSFGNVQAFPIGP